MNTVEARAYILKAIEEEPKHKHYQHVCDHADFYMRMISGTGQAKDMRIFDRRESQADFDQAVRITQTITPAMTGSVMQIYEKVHGVDPIVDLVDYDVSDKKGFDKQIQEVRITMDKFYGDDSVDQYLATRIHTLSFVDPNAFTIVEFDNVDTKKTKVKPRPIEYSSHECIDYGYNRDRTLNYLFVKEKIKIYKTVKVGTVVSQIEERDGLKYTLYFKDYAWVLKELYDGTVDIIKPGELITDKGKSKYFQLNTYASKAGMVQAKCIGYIQDVETNGETYVSPLHRGKSYLMKTIKSVREMDLTESLHAHPQKISYQQPCTLTKDKGTCVTSGCRPDSCDMCGSTSMHTPTTTQEMIVFKLPKNPADVFDITKMVFFHHPDTGFLKLMMEIIEGHVQNFHRTCFNTNKYVKDSIENTATAVNKDSDNAFDPLKKYAAHMARLWEFFVTCSANFTDNGKNLIVDRVYGSDFNLKTFSEKLLELQMANASQAPGPVRAILTKSIMKDLYKDDPNLFKKYEAKQNHFPFTGKTEQEILLLMAGTDVTEFDRTKWANFDAIFDELELESEPVWFYDLTIQRQRELVKAKVDAIIAAKPKEEIVLPKNDNKNQ